MIKRFRPMDIDPPAVNESDLDKLLSCLCGAKAEYFETQGHTVGHGESANEVGVRCTGCGNNFSLGDYTGYKTDERKAEAAKLWNNRPISQTLTPDIEEDKVWQRDAHRYLERGLKCVLWGRKTQEMSREDLISFIGFLDELSTLRYKNTTMKNPLGN